MKIGYDVEFYQTNRDGLPVFPSTKRYPTWEVTQDNMMNEVRSKPGHETYDTQALIHNLYGFKKWAKRTEKFATPAMINWNDVVAIPEETWNQIPDELKILGCQPDTCIYTDKFIDPSVWHNIPIRTAGGHIHIGINTPNKEFNLHELPIEECDGLPQYQVLKNAEDLIKNLDAIVALSNVIWNQRNGKERRQMYGKAGTGRLKPYGIEYRVLDNSWIFYGWTIDLTISLTKAVIEAMTIENTTIVKNEEIGELIKTINNNDSKKALEAFPVYLKRLNKIRPVNYSTLLYPETLIKLHQGLYKKPITCKDRALADTRNLTHQYANYLST
jgi:hypothetical protein